LQLHAYTGPLRAAAIALSSPDLLALDGTRSRTKVSLGYVYARGINQVLRAFSDLK
jgi:hypothetical protein